MSPLLQQNTCCPIFLGVNVQLDANLSKNRAHQMHHDQNARFDGCISSVPYLYLSDQMPTLISTSMPPSITNGDLPLLAQKQTIVKIEICSKYDICKERKREITSLHFYCLLNMIMLEHLEAASPLTRTGAGQRTERKIRYIDKEWFSMEIVM